LGSSLISSDPITISWTISLKPTDALAYIPVPLSKFSLL
jgi:hypothetical protein